MSSLKRIEFLIDEPLFILVNKINKKAIGLKKILLLTKNKKCYLHRLEKRTLIAFLYENGIFSWDDTEDPLEGIYGPPNTHISWGEFDWIIKHEKEVETAMLFIQIKEHLKSRNFNAAKKLLPKLEKINKQSYTDLDNDILLRLFKIE